MSLDISAYEVPSERSDVAFAVSEPLPIATEPVILQSDRFALAEDAPAKLQAFGFTKRQAHGFAVVMHKVIEDGAFNAEGGEIVGTQKGCGAVTSDQEGAETFYPLAVGVVSGKSLAETNHTVLHELGHVLWPYGAGGSRKHCVS